MGVEPKSFVLLGLIFSYITLKKGLESVENFKKEWEGEIEKKRVLLCYLSLQNLEGGWEGTWKNSVLAKNLEKKTNIRI